MAELTDLSDIINRVTGGNNGTPEHLFFHKDARVAGAAANVTVAGRMTSLWLYDGTPGAGEAPGAVAIPTNATNGGLKQTDPGGERLKWLLGMVAASLNTGTLILYDRLLHISGLDATVTDPQNVGGSITRYTDGIGNQIWAEIYTLIGSTARTLVAAYTDDLDGSSNTPATVFGGTGYREAQRMIVLPLATGTKGVKGVTSVTISVSTGTAGNFGINIVHPLAVIPLGVVGCGSVRDFIAGLPSIQEIKTDACLALAWIATGTVAPQILGSIHMIEK